MGSRHTRRLRCDIAERERESDGNRDRPDASSTSGSTQPAVPSGEGSTANAEQHGDADDGQTEATGAAVPASISDDDEEDSDIVTILTQLLRSGQVRIVRASFGGGSGIHIIRGGASFEDSDDPGDIASLFHNTMSVPPVDPCPDTTGLDNTDIKQQILLDTGQFSTSCNVARALHKRESAGFGQQHFTPAHQALFSSNYLPNPGNMKVKAQYTHKAFCGTYSRDGSTFASACQDQQIRVYHTSKGQFKEFRRIRGQNVGWSIVDMDYSPDQQYLIYSSWSDYIHLCNIYGEHSTHEALYLNPEDRKFCAFSVVFSQDNREILAGSNGGDLYVYDRGSHQRTLRIDGHEDDVNSVVFAGPSSQIVFSASDDGLCKVWDRRTLREASPVPVGILAGHSDGLTCVDPKGDGFHLITNSKDQTIKLWDVRKFSGDDAVTATKNAVAAQHWDYRWQPVPRRVHRAQKLPGDTSLMTYRGHGVLHTLVRSYFSPALTTGQRYIYSGCSTGSVIIYDVLTGKLVRRLHGHRSCVRDVSWHPYEASIVSTSWDGTLGLWQYSGREEDVINRTTKGTSF